MTPPTTHAPLDSALTTPPDRTTAGVDTVRATTAITRPRQAPDSAPTAAPPVPAPTPMSLGALVASRGESGRGTSHHSEPRVRAAVAVLLGRGDRAEPFHLLADRLALDGYLVTVVPDGGSRVSAVAENRVPGVPFVLLGSDTGALAALAMAASPAVRPDGVVLLGLPLLHVPVAGVPVEEPAPRALPDLPILLVHGADDEVSPLSLVSMTTRTAPRADLEVVPGGHDVLTGPGRRCVAARTLLFLESLLAT